MSRTVAERRRRPDIAAGVTWTALIHGAALAAALGGIKTVAPSPPVYAVELVAAPLPQPAARPAPETVSRPVEAEDPGPPVPTPKPVVAKPAPKAPPKPKPTAPQPSPASTTKEPPPRTTSAVTPAPGETPGTGSDEVNVKTPGLAFPYPDYLRNIVAQVYRRWSRPGGNQTLRAEVSFFILRDGTVRDIRFVTPSGNFSFDLSAQGAIEAAGNTHAFGSLPDGYDADVLPVSFFFTPRGAR
jgi:periplasmic protein TonB